MENRPPQNGPRRPRPLRVKVISIGDAGTGKSCIIKRYCEKRFVPRYISTIGIDFGVTKVSVKDKELKVNFFDMAGLAFFMDVRNEFYKDTQGVILAYDVSQKETFEHLDAWIAEMTRETGDLAKSNISVMVCANKVDQKNRSVTEQEGRAWATAHGFAYFETSANTGLGISEMFDAMFCDIVAINETGTAINTKKPTYTAEQVEAIQKIKSSRDDYDRLGVKRNATVDEINRNYRKLAVLLHPDKNSAPGSEEAFKALVTARATLLKDKS